MDTIVLKVYSEVMEFGVACGISGQHSDMKLNPNPAERALHTISVLLEIYFTKYLLITHAYSHAEDHRKQTKTRSFLLDQVKHVYLPNISSPPRFPLSLPW